MLSSVFTSDQASHKETAMKPCDTRRFMYALLVLGMLLSTTRANATAAEFNPYTPAKVVAHLPLSGAGATQMFLRQEGKTRYLYLQRSSQQGFTVINVTKPERPKVVSRMPLVTRTIMGSGLVITETPDLSAAVRASGATEDEDGNLVPESIHVLQVSDSEHPWTVQTFNDVTGILQDSARNLIYVVNGDGIWILSRRRTSYKRKCSSSDAISSIPDCD